MKSLFVIYGLLLAVFLIMVVISPTYRSAENIGNIIVQCVPLAVVSLGQTVVMIGGGIDMSVGSLISLSTCIAAVVMKPGTGLSLALGILAVFLVAGIVGLCNGIGANYAKVPPLITTLSMMILLSGVAQGRTTCGRRKGQYRLCKSDDGSGRYLLRVYPHPAYCLSHHPPLHVPHAHRRVGLRHR